MMQFHLVASTYIKVNQRLSTVNDPTVHKTRITLLASILWIIPNSDALEFKIPCSKFRVATNNI